MATTPAPANISTAKQLAAGARRKSIGPTPEDLEAARSDALLQLRIGRSAHYTSVVVSLALLADGVLVLYLLPEISTYAPPPINGLLFLLFPLLAGVYLSVFGVRVKWSAYKIWPWETHFSLTLGALALSAFLTYLYFAAVFAYGPTGHWNLVPWFYAATLAGIALPLAALAMTWPEWTSRKTISVACAVLPVPLAFLLYLPPGNAQSTATALAATLFASAVLYQASGSFLHLIASGTQPHEREVTSSAQGRMVLVADELRQKEDALRFRESTVIRREADAEATETSLTLARQSLEEAQSQFAKFESDLDERTKALAQEREQWAGEVAQAAALRRQSEDREATLRMREQEVSERLPKVTERENNLLHREGEATRHEVELAQRESEVKRRLDTVPEVEAHLESRRQEIEQRTAELLRHEAEFKSREALLATTPADRSTVQQRLASIEAREAQLGKLKIALDEQNAALGRRARQTEGLMEEVRRAEAQQKSRLDEIGRREETLARENQEWSAQAGSRDGREKQLAQLLEQYESRMGEADRRTLDLTGRAGELSRQQALLVDKERGIRDREQRMNSDRSSLEQNRRELLEREKALAAREAEVSLKAQEVALKAAPRPPWEETGAVLAGAATGVVDLAHRAGGGVTASKAAPPPLLARKGVSTGIPRLDTLLKGGVGPGGHILLIGPPFIGKEVVLYSYLAEGLARGEPIVIVTASRTREEVAQELGMICPQLREYEQIGRVLWVDASTPGGTNGGAAKKVAVKGPDDHAGILSGIVQSAQRASPKDDPFRVGFLGLSTCLAHGDEKEGLRFLQNLVGILKPRKCRAMYTVDSGTVTEIQIESIQTRMDGAIRFREENGKTALSAQGFADVETRAWVDYKSSNRTLTIGSFSLERIR